MSYNASLLHVNLSNIGILGLDRLDDITGCRCVSHPHMTGRTRATPAGVSVIAAATLRVRPPVSLEPNLDLGQCNTYHNDNERRQQHQETIRACCTARAPWTERGIQLEGLCDFHDQCCQCQQ